MQRDGLAELVIPALDLGRPPPALDPALDAAAACFARFGLARTSVPDIARELGVSRATVYRTAGTVEHLAQLLVGRELRRLLIDAIAGSTGPMPARAVEVLDVLLRSIREHPVLAKVLAHEADLVHARLLEGWPTMLAQLRPPIADALIAGMGAGSIRRGDADLMAEAISRLALSLVINPTPHPRPLLEQVLLPMLTPSEDGAD